MGAKGRAPGGRELSGESPKIPGFCQKKMGVGVNRGAPRG